MQEWWRTVLRLRFFYLRELLLGVLVWERSLIASTDFKQVVKRPSSASGQSLAPVTFKVINLTQEQEIFSSDKYQKSVSQLMVGEPQFESPDLGVASASSWVAVGAMLEQRKKRLEVNPISDSLTSRSTQIVPITQSRELQKMENDSEHIKQPPSLDLSKSNLDLSKSRLDLSKPTRRQFIRDIMPIFLSSKLLTHQEGKDQDSIGEKRQNDGQKEGKSHNRVSERKQNKKAHSRKKRLQTRRNKVGYWLSWLLITAGVFIAIIFLAPDLYFKLVPADVIKLGEITDPSIKLPSNSQNTPTPTPTPYIPPIDPDLPAGQWLIIPEIGVKTQPQATEDPEIALKDGVWIAPEYGQIGQSGLPIIMAAHRFGWKWWWQSDYWKLNSFYNLPETKPGTLVELIADQRKWTYLIYGGEEGDAITDYSADLILYTCKFLNSPIRHVRYARLIDPNQPELVLNPDQRPLSDDEKTELGKLFSLPY